MERDDDDFEKSLALASATADLMQYRLEQLAQDIESEYKRFDSWRDKCDNMNQWLTESEKLIKNEEKIGSDIDVLQEQIKDNQLFLNEVKEYEPKVNAMVQESQDLVDSSKLDKTDIDGVDKTKNALNSRWKAVNDHLKERQQKLDSALLDILKKDTEGRLGRWREQSIALGLLVSEATRKVEQDVDETDYGDIQASVVQLQEVENSLAEDLSRELVEVSDSGRDIIEKEELQPDVGDEVSETLDALNRQVTDLEKGTRDKKDRIKESSLKYFGRSLADCEEAVEKLGETSVNSFTDVGSDIGEVGKQLAELQEFESDLVIEEATFSDIKDQFEDSKGTEMLREEDRARIQRRIDALDEKWAELNKNHDENHRKLTHAMIVLHEELMEEIYDWLGDAEKQADSIAVNEDDISSVMEEYGRHRELKNEISSFDPTFKKAIGISDRLLTERLVDPERAESYETEISTLEKRWKNLQLKTMDNGAKLSGVLGRYITTRLDDAEIILTQAESSISRDDADYLDLEAAKKALDAFRVKKTEINESQKKVDEILTESQAIVKEEFFKEHERDHFQGRIDMIDKRNKGLEEKADKEERRMLDTYILLLKQHLQRMNVWLKMAESRVKQEGEIGPGYDDVKKQLEDHQVFQEELRDHSMITMILGVDITNPDINDSTQQQVKSLSDRWSKVWNWSEQRKHQLLKVLSNWQRFRDEQLILLNWLSSKEKTLKDMGRTDLTDEDEVKEHLEKLRIIEKELDEQGIRLQSLHKAGEDLLKNVDKGDPAAKEINTQLKDFDDCWNDIAKQVINRIQQLETSQSKINEFHSEMDATNEWMDETEKLLKSFSVGMEPEEATKLQEKTEIKCEERSRYAAKVDRINQLGKDLAGEIDQPSHDAIQEELQPFNARWSDVSSQLENFSDKGYPQPGSECCFLRIMRRKFGVFQ
ncbi:dystonin-like isoform X2 [Orbicella faveolata]|uniref:dystonin-like isoform X2 n=1 Tax=Orbicella faveolata TaxID=48498 RepID=UPI0009E657F9|nr:dystonin-like isoform X2 [Orbicella faveolata]